MNIWRWLILISIAFFGFTRKSFATEAILAAPESRNGGFTAGVELLHSPLEAVSLALTESASGKPIRVSLEPQAVNLWILADTGRICSLEKMDVHLTSVMGLLAKALPQKSTVTYTSYTSTSRDTIAQQVAVTAAESIRVACEPQMLSGSYENALLRLFENAASSELPTKVWVFTSGNISLSERMQKKIKDKGIPIAIFLYNPRLDAEIREIAQTQQLAIGADLIRYSVLKRDEGIVPARYFQLAGKLPSELLGKSVALKAKFLKGSDSLAQSSFSVQATGKRGLPWEILALSLIAAVSLGYLIFRMVRYYRPRHCRKCHRRQRFEEPYCLFCLNEGDACLLSSPKGLVGADKQREQVLYFAEPIVELGTHRKSLYAFARAPFAKRQCFVKLIREQVGIQRWAYKLIRVSDSREIEVLLNGQPLIRNRYLASGDELVVDSIPFVFFMKRKDQNEPATA